jgi:Tfp pilus assembly protein PilN
MPAQINLLSKQNFAATRLMRTSTWALSVGRWIVILTELVVISAFISRFRLDRDIANLTEKINERAAIVDAYSATEDIFRYTQKRLQILNQATDQHQNYYLILVELEKTLPQEIALSYLTIQENSLSLKGTAMTEHAMAGFEQQLKLSSLFSNVGLTQVDSEDSNLNQFEFELKAKIIQ